MLAVIRSAIAILKTAMLPEHSIVHRLARSTVQAKDSVLSEPAPHQTSTSRLDVRGRRLAQHFLICKYRGGTRFTNAAEINEAVRRSGWNATLVAANLAAYCEVAGHPGFWERGDEQGQLARHQIFIDWEDKAGDSAKKVKEGMGELERCVTKFAERYGIDFE